MKKNVLNQLFIIPALILWMQTGNAQPIITCATQTTPIECPAAPVWVSATATGGCEGSNTISFTEETIAGTCTSTYLTTRTWTATDNCGNSASCSATIAVEDITAPDITCATHVTPIECPNIPEWVDATATDACDPNVSIDFSDNILDGSCAGTYTARRTWTATDDCGHYSTCSREIIVRDTVAPSISCTDLTVSASFNCNTIVNFVLNGYDNCGSVSEQSNPSSGSSFPIGTTIVQGTVTDNCGNVSTCTFNVNIIDDKGPIISCPPNVQANVGPNCSAATVTYGQPFVIVECSPYNISQISGIPSGGLFPVGTTLNVFKVEDIHGNSTNCVMEVTVSELEFPIISCPPNVEINLGSGCGPSEAFYGQVLVLQECSPYTVTQISGIPSGGIFPLGYTENWFRVDDDFGNSSTCGMYVRIYEEISPIIHCPGNIVIALDAEHCDTIVNYAVTAEDNCGITNILVLPASGSTFNLGVTQVLAKTKDLSGNVVTCNFTITVTGDDDCDGVANACDVCPGGDDRIDNNNDGHPDCKVYPGFSFLPADWKCGNDNSKVVVCHNNSTKCYKENQVQSHLNHGDYCGPCNQAACTPVVPMQTNNNTIAFSNDTEQRIIKTDSESELEIFISPNPVSNHMLVSFNKDILGDIVIYNVIGKKVFSQTIDVPTTQVSIDAQTIGSWKQDGIYILAIKYQSELISKKFNIILEK